MMGRKNGASVRKSLWISIWTWFNSKILKYQEVQLLAKSDTENAELASKMLRQQHFLHQRKNLYIPILKRIFSSEPDSDANHDSSWLGLFFYSPIHSRTLYRIVWWRGDCWAAREVWCQKIVRGRRIISGRRVTWSEVWHSTVLYEGTEVLLYFEDKKYWVSGQIIWKYRISAETVPDSQTGNICRNLW